VRKEGERKVQELLERAHAQENRGQHFSSFEKKKKSSNKNK
jgi:hypothetical protein